MKRSWLQIVCIVVAGLASTTGCGNKPTQTADATGGTSSGATAGQSPTGAGHGASFGNESDSSSPAGSSGYGGPSSGDPGTGGGPSAGGPGDGGHGGPSSGGPSSGGPGTGGGPSVGGPGGGGHGGPSSGGPSSGGPGAGGGPSAGGPGGGGHGGPSTGAAGSGSAPPYGEGYGAAAGFNAGGPGMSGMGAPGVGMTGMGAPGVGMTGMGAPGVGMAGAGGAGFSSGGNSGDLGAGAGSGNASGSSPASKPLPPKKLTFEERSKIAFQAGNTQRAYDLAYAHSLMSPDSDAMKVATAYRVAPTKSSPAIGVQIAVGLALEKPDGVTDLKPIGTDWQSITGGGSGGGPGSGPGGPGMGGMGMGMGGIGMPGMDGSPTNTTSGSKALTDAAGELATDFIEAFKQEHAEGKWSLYFKDEELQRRSLTSGQPGMGGMAGGFPPGGEEGMGGMAGFGGLGAAGGMGAPGAGRPGDGSGGSGAPGGALQFRQSGIGMAGIGPGAAAGGGDDSQGGPGMAGVGIGGPGGVGHGAGAPGGVGPGGMGPGGVGPGGVDGSGAAPGMGGYGAAPGMGGFGGAPGMGGQTGAGGVARPSIDPADVKLAQGIVPLAPCLHYIGAADAKSLVETAYEQGYDALVIFEVEVTQNRRNNVVTNTALIRCVIPADSPKNVESLVKSKSLVNRDVAQARRKKENDGVEDVVKSVLRRMGEKVSLQPIPEKITPDYIIKNRLPTLVANEKLSKLCKLSEVNFYYHKGYLDEAQRADFYERIAGELAEDVLSEDLEVRETAILELLNS
ncbi:MAG: hypothetical protein ACK5PB_11425 [Pirellula sp.]